MGLILLALFIGVPLLEIAVFIQVGGLIGLWPTLGLVILTAMAGTWHLRAQGLATLERARRQLDRGVLPTRELFDGLCLLVSGALLLTPGFVTDAAGLLLFLAPVRDWLRGVLARHLAAKGKTRVWVDGEEIIEGEFRDVTPEDPEAAPERLNPRKDPRR